MFIVPGIDAGEIDVLPTEWRDVFQQGVRNAPALLPQMRDGAAEVDGVPMHDGADDEIEARSTERLAFERPVADLTAFVEEDGALEFVGRLAFVEPGLAAPAKRRA